MRDGNFGWSCVSGLRLWEGVFIFGLGRTVISQVYLYRDRNVLSFTLQNIWRLDFKIQM